jgi:hypothetical protein
MTLADPSSDAVAERLSALEARFARIEAAVDRLAGALESWPGLVAMTGDVLDEEVERLARRGVDVDARLRAASHAAEVVTRPQVLSRVEHLAEQATMLDDTVAMMGDIADELTARIEAETGVLTEHRLAAVTGALVRLSDPATLAMLNRALDLAATAEGTLGMTLDIVDEWVAGLAARGQDPAQRVADVRRLLDRALHPNTLRLAHKVLDKADNLEQLLDVALAAPDTLGMMMDVADEILRRAEAEGLQLDLLLERTIQVALRAGRLAGSDELQELIDSYVLDPAAVRTVSLAANAMAETRDEPIGRAGIWRAIGALSDPEIQTALDFAIRFGRRFGAAVRDPSALPVRR